MLALVSELKEIHNHVWNTRFHMKRADVFGLAGDVRCSNQPRSPPQTSSIFYKKVTVDSFFTKHFLTLSPLHLHPPRQGDQYWRFDGNMMMEPGFPKPLTSEFPGVMGPITAALPVPATRSRPEAVHFFKNGEEDREERQGEGMLSW